MCARRVVFLVALMLEQNYVYCVNIAPQATSYLTSVNNNTYTITGQGAWITDGVTSGPCASVSSLHPAWKAEFGQNRTVHGIKIFWEGPQKDVIVSVGGRICHTVDSSYTWMSEYTLNCGVPVTGDNLLMYRRPDGGMLNLSLCEVEIFGTPVTTSRTASSTLTSTIAMPQNTKTRISTNTLMESTTTSSSSIRTLSSSTMDSGVSQVVDSGDHDDNFPLLNIIVVAAGTVGVVAVVAVVTVVSVRRTKRRRSAAKDAEEAVVASYEGCVAEPREHKYSDLDPTKPQNTNGMMYENVQHGSDHTSMYVNTTATTSYENIQDDVCTYVNIDYDIEQDRSNGRSCYVNTGYDVQHMKDSAQASMYVNTTDLGLYENTLNIRT
ncbi:uncharacterized protein LOC124121913 [Haliotis rufescens]|uniref:uncharacterized protein LOC124121913 n=1 Tax=Haliotis rufescens TaxID=6454 RepID=UPI00201F52C3|nr:uncharacterized protein LOC124121913 [Haliotis rufescens]